jgi:hypothetical protein
MCQNLSNHNTTECLPRAPKVLRTLDSFCLNFLKLLETCKPRTDCNKLPSRTPRTFAEATVTLPRPSPRRSTRMNHTWPLHISSLARSLARSLGPAKGISLRSHGADVTAPPWTPRCFPGRSVAFPNATHFSRRNGTPRRALARAPWTANTVPWGTGAAGTGLAPSTPSLFPTDTI